MVMFAKWGSNERRWSRPRANGSGSIPEPRFRSGVPGAMGLRVGVNSAGVGCNRGLGLVIDAVNILIKKDASSSCLDLHLQDNAYAARKKEGAVKYSTVPSFIAATAPALSAAGREFHIPENVTSCHRGITLVVCHKLILHPGIAEFGDTRNVF